MRAAKSRRIAPRILLCAIALALVVSGCAGPLLVPNPPPPTVTPRAETPAPAAPAPAPSAEPDDFGSVFDDISAAGDDKPLLTVPEFFPIADTSASAQPFTGIDTTAPQPSLRYPPYKIPRKRLVRVAVRRGAKQLSIQTPSGTTVYTPEGVDAFKGHMQIEIAVVGKSVVASVNNTKKELPMPCTLYVSSNVDGHLRLGDERYRGSLVITPDDNWTIKVVNILDVEDYLRGVVPLEIGNLKDPDIEAVKAQAVAARTYTYQRMTMRAADEFDLVNTVSDQVYGGVNAEGQTPDMAIRLTRDLVMVYGEMLVNAYYHSTCGGVTANIEDVWGAAALPYLRSAPDTRPDGSAYCGASNWFTWSEKWTKSQMSDIIKRHAADGRLQPSPYRGGSLQKIDVREKYACGRVKALHVKAGGHDYTASGDKVRFLLRRHIKGNPILRSSLITEIKTSGSEITITGRGHGHGIGMCQVGAINRSRDGQNFEEILKTYYTGVTIRTVAD